MLVGAVRPDEGRVEFEGQRLSETSADDPRGRWRRSSTTSTSSPTCRSWSTWTCWPAPTASPTPTPLVDEVLAEVQLVPQSGQLPGHAESSGQRRRLALATAFVRPRRLLVLDEPEQRLDVEGVAWLAARLQAERKEGLAVVFASHDPYLVREVATREVHLSGGSGGSGSDVEETVA
jgi:ABC-2 type transport system ATP-binding protein